MEAINGLSKLIAWMIVVGIKVVVYPVYIISDITSKTCRAILDMISSKDVIDEI